MSYSPESANRSGPVSMYVGPFSREGGSSDLPWAAPASATLTANGVYAFPLVIPSPCTVRRFFWVNGATASTNNVQVGLYWSDQTSLLLGTQTLASGASTIQYDDVTDTVIAPGRYWIALWVSGATTTLLRVSNLSSRLAWMVGQVTSPGAGLPATLGNAGTSASAAAWVPVFGFTTRATP